ncbi:MAG: DUF359 domain-containing protein [Candidatus Thermoplasmatota archaeon]
MFGKKEMRLASNLRDEMREVIGEIATGERLMNILRTAGRIISIGDVCTAELFKNGMRPKLAIIDSRTRRGTAPPISIPQGYEIVKVRNPPEQITVELWQAVERALRSEGDTIILVEGEEDLSALVCIYLAPDDTTVIYGIPDEGAMVVNVSAGLRARAEKILASMEEQNGD